jgi:hypothetical protein
MDALKQEDRRKFAAQFWIENKHNGRPYVVKMLKNTTRTTTTFFGLI